MEYSWAIERKEPLDEAQKHYVEQKSQTQKSTYGITLFTWILEQARLNFGEKVRSMVDVREMGLWKGKCDIPKLMDEAKAVLVGKFIIVYIYITRNNLKSIT